MKSQLVVFLLGCLNLATSLRFRFDSNEVKAIVDMQDAFQANSNNKGFIGDVQVLGPQGFTFLEGIFRFGLFFGNIDPEDPVVPPQVQNVATLLFADVIVVQNANEFFSDIVADVANTNFRTGAQQDAQLALASAIIVSEPLLPHNPHVFCLFDSQCRGGRKNDKHKRTCNNLGPNDGIIAECDSFVSTFCLTWLLLVCLYTYLALIIWAIYFGYPYLKKKFSSGIENFDANKRKTRLLTNTYSQQEQTIINTLAVQCAAAENLLFQSSDLLKQAHQYGNVIAVEVQNQAKMMVYTVEYFQACCAIIVSLSHQYLNSKTFTPGEKFDLEDCTTRALQLELLAYVRDRLLLAFNAENPEVTFVRLGEAYAIMKKITDGISMVGFTNDLEAEGGIGNLRTPTVNLTEDAFFLSGKFPSQQNERSKSKSVAIIVKGASPRSYATVKSTDYLENRSKESKIYDPMMQMTQKGIGVGLSFSFFKNETFHNFAKVFFARELQAIQQEAPKWDQGDNLVNFLNFERQEREQKAQLRKSGEKSGANPLNPSKSKRHRRKKKGDPSYREKSRNAESSDMNMRSAEWSFGEVTTGMYVFNVKSVINQGFSIAGKPGMPYDKPRQTQSARSYWYDLFQSYAPNYAEWPKFYTFIFVLMPFLIMIPLLVKIRKGATALDLDGNPLFKARAAGFGRTFLGIQPYYFLDGFIPLAEDLVGEGDAAFDRTDAALIDTILQEIENPDPFGVGTGRVFISNDQAAGMFENDFNGAFGRLPDNGIAEIQAGILSQRSADDLLFIRNHQLRQEVTAVWVYALLHVSGYFFGILPITLVRESLEVIARRAPVLREVYPLSIWKELHMQIGLSGILCVVVGTTFMLISVLVGMGHSTPFAGIAGDLLFPNFFELKQNVLFLRMLVFPWIPTLLLMKYADRGPPKLMQKYAPTWMTLNYWEICYGIHYVVGITAIIMIVIYRSQVFYWVGATWGFLYGGNKMFRVLRTRKTTLADARLVSYTVSDDRNNAKKVSNVLRVALNVPPSFPLSSRGQACWITVPNIDYIAHPFTLAKVPTSTDRTILFHIAVRYLPGDDIISGARPAAPSARQKEQLQGVIPSEAAMLPSGWRSNVDPQTGQTYYFNPTTQKASWNFPKLSIPDKMFEGFQGVKSRLSTAVVGSARFGSVQKLGNALYSPNSKIYNVSERPTWTQQFAKFCIKMQSIDPDLRKNQSKTFPIYVSAPLGTTMDEAIKPSLPGSVIITTQNGLPAAESCVRWLFTQPSTNRPAFHFFVSVSREINDALAVVEMLRNGLCEAVSLGTINIDGVTELSHLMDWLGVYIHLTRRKPSQIIGDRELLLKALKPPPITIPEEQLRIIENFVKGRIQPGRLPFDRFLTRVQQMVHQRTGADNVAVGYCGSAAVAYSIRAIVHKLPRVTFDGEFI